MQMYLFEISVNLSDPLTQIIGIMFILFIIALVIINIGRKRKEKLAQKKPKTIEKEKEQLLESLKEELKQ